MDLFSRINTFVEDKLGIRSYPVKVVSLFALIVFVSMFLTFSVDVLISYREVKEEIRIASERAALFRTTAIRNVVLGLFQGDVALADMIGSRGIESAEPFLGSYITCAYDGERLLGSVETDLLQKALHRSGNRSFYFYLLPDSWLGIAVVRRGGRTYAFCHRVPYLQNILSKRLGAISKYGAEFYFGKRPQVEEGDVFVSYESGFSNASMFVVVPSRNILQALIKDRVIIYMRTYLILLLFLGVSYLLWARLINYPVMKLREALEALESGNYDLDLSDIASAKDEFGFVGRLLRNYARETRQRFEKLELIMETAFSSVSSPEEVPGFVKGVLDRIEDIFGARASLFVIEERGKVLMRIPSSRTLEEQASSLMEFYRRTKGSVSSETSEPVCFKESGKRGCRSIVLFKLDEVTEGGLVFSFREEMDRVNESYLKILCQHIVGTIKLSHLASTDPLTGIPNRRMLEIDMRNFGRLAKRYNKLLSLVMLDIDNFKSVNDTYGHAVGDEVLKRIAGLIKESVRDTDRVYRYGGEEFAILCPETDKRGAYELSERIRERIKGTGIDIGEGRQVFITVSLGVASFPEDAEDPEDLLTVADLSLYRAKSEGKDKTVAFLGSREREEYLERFRSERELAELIHSGSYTHHLQPIYDIQRDYVFGYELLFRVVKDGEEIPMGSFISGVEDVSLLERIDLITLRHAVELLKQDELYRYTFFINVSPRSLERGKLFSELSKLPRRYRSRIYLEITERETFLNAEEALRCMEELKNLGYRVVIDDFGSGFSTLSSMRNFIKFLDLIKVDGSFIKNLKRDPYNRAILESIKAMADRFSIDIVAEYIETYEDLETVRKMGIRFGQGFYFGKADIKAIA